MDKGPYAPRTRVDLGPGRPWLQDIVALGTLQEAVPHLLPVPQPGVGGDSRGAEPVQSPPPAFLASAKGPREAAQGSTTTEGTPTARSTRLCPGEGRGLPAEAGLAQYHAPLAPETGPRGARGCPPLPLHIPRMQEGSAVLPSHLRAIQTVLPISTPHTRPLLRRKGTLSSGRTH